MQANKRPGGILAFRNDRLGGRLNAILIAMRVAGVYNTNFRIFWTLTDLSAAELQHPEELFAQKFMAEHFTSPEEGRSLFSSATDITFLPKGMDREGFEASLDQGKYYLVNIATERFFLPWEQRSAFDNPLELIDQIEFHPRVMQMMQRINERLDGLNFKSYHLRRGDIIDEKLAPSHNLWPKKYIPRVFYEAHMRRELEQGDGQIVIFSDSPDEATAFSAMSPRIKSFSDLIGDADLTTLQRDFLELYTMSRSERIIAPASSAFSGVAAALGNKQVIDILADLTPNERKQALDELVRRLENTPEVFINQSDIGQTLPFVAAHLDGKGEGGRATNIASGYLRGGLDRAYIYPFVSGRLLAQGDFDEIDQLLEKMADKLCYRVEHWSTVYIHAAIADMMRDNWSRALSRYQSGAWFNPVDPNVSRAFQYLISTGQLTPQNGYPFDPDMMRRIPTIYDTAGNPVLSALMDKLTAANRFPQQYPSQLDIRDWRPIQGKKLNMRFNSKELIIQNAEYWLQVFGRTVPAAAMNSTMGRMMLDAEEYDRAERYLNDSLDQAPDNPLYQKRLADFLFAKGANEAGLSLLEKAAAGSDNHPCYMAELAIRYRKLGKKGRSQEILLDLRHHQLQLPELRLIIMDAMRQDAVARTELPGYIAGLEAVTPGAQRALMTILNVYLQSGMWEEAMRVAKKLLLLPIAEPVLRPRISGLFKAYAQEFNQDLAKKWFAENGIKEELTKA